MRRAAEIEEEFRIDRRWGFQHECIRLRRSRWGNTSRGDLLSIS